MKMLSRRQVICRLLASSMTLASSNRTSSAAPDDLEFGLVDLCVVSRQAGRPRNALVDIWTSQVGTLDIRELPETLGRVVVWHDVRGVKGLSQSISDILLAIDDYFGITPSLGTNTTACVGRLGSLSSSLNFRMLDCPSAVSSRVAVIDLGSCGLTDLCWIDLIPLLRVYYTHVVGVDYSVPEFCELDAKADTVHGLSELAREALGACDHWLLASDESLTGRSDLSVEERSFEFAQAVCELGQSLVIADTNLEVAIRSSAQRQFVAFGVKT